MKFALRIVNSLLLAALVASSALAADLTNLLPQESVIVVGVEGLAAHESKLSVFTEEWNRLDLSRLLGAAMGDGDSSDPQIMTEVLTETEILDVIGDEAWIGLSVASFNPMPAITMIARATPEASAAYREQFLASEGDFQTFTEGNISFTVLTAPADPEDEGDPFSAAFSTTSLAQFDGITVISSNPDVMRGVLRRHQGSNEPGLASNAGFAATIGQLSAANGYFFLDLPTIVKTAAPFGAGMGFDSVIARVSGAFDVGGVFGATTTITADGLEGRNLRVLGNASGDPRAHALLTQSVVVSDATAAFISPSTVGYSVSHFDLPGWWGWLKSVVESSPELGISDVDGLLGEMVGIDLNRLLMGWMGTEVAAITGPSAPTAEIGMAIENPLGDSVYAVSTRDAAAAEAGISELFMMASMMLSQFTSADGMGSQTGPVSRMVAGVNVTDYSFGDMMTISTAVVDGYALIATTAAAMDDALNARQQGGILPASLAGLKPMIPSGVTSYSISDDSATMRTLAQSISAELGMVVGFAPGDIDFDAADDAGAAMASFLNFVANRLSGSYMYTYVDGNNLRGNSHTKVAW
ncbi:MAG: hypothetical protein KF813_11480 [Trueperaceae bacterium]|nr:hypothetical protein [Trueperaceae bacterium]